MYRGRHVTPAVATPVITSFKVTNFGTNGKPVCNFLLVNNKKLNPISHCLHVVADYWSNFHC